MMDQNFKQIIHVPCDRKDITCELVLPEGAAVIIIFSQGDGSSTKSDRSKLMALSLQQHGFGTLLPDLLDPEEARSFGRQYDIQLLSRRLNAVTHWIVERDLLRHYRFGFFATSTGAAAALRIASLYPDHIGAVVCRGGRPDLAKAILPLVESPTLLIVGALDRYVLELNIEALEELPCTKQLDIIPGATHLFEGDRMNEMIASTTAWFERHLHASAILTH